MPKKWTYMAIYVPFRHIKSATWYTSLTGGQGFPSICFSVIFFSYFPFFHLPLIYLWEHPQYAIHFSPRNNMIWTCSDNLSLNLFHSMQFTWSLLNFPSQLLSLCFVRLPSLSFPVFTNCCGIFIFEDCTPSIGAVYLLMGWKWHLPPVQVFPLPGMVNSKIQ